jgi:hypothetical protein
MIVLADYNLNRQAILISGSLVAGGWLDLAPIQIDIQDYMRSGRLFIP